jgi:hypothetical protein
MKDFALVDRIRKLLRLAQKESIEGMLAGVRAKELMAKHGLDVSLNDTVRQAMPGISGVYWKEQLLLTLSIPRRCKLMQSTQDENLTVLVGDSDDVASVVRIYTQCVVEATLKCEGAYQDFLDERFEHHDHRDFMHKDIVKAWYGVHMENAAKAVVLKLKKGVKVQEAPPVKEGPASPVREKPSEEKKQIEGTLERLIRAIELLGRERAQMLYQKALSTGLTSGDTIEVLSGCKLIPERSSITQRALAAPKPKEITRFSELDLE